MRPDGYTLTFFEPGDGQRAFDGMATLVYHDAERAAAHTGRNIPAVVAEDGWADLVDLPNVWLQVSEHVMVPGPHGEATPEEREGAYKLTFLVRGREGVDPAQVRGHWLDLHAPNVASGFVAAGGVRYVVNLVERAAGSDVLGVAELLYRDRASARAHRIAEDGFDDLTTGVALPGHEVVIVP
jgi:hypothetical protein